MKKIITMVLVTLFVPLLVLADNVLTIDTKKYENNEVTVSGSSSFSEVMVSLFDGDTLLSLKTVTASNNKYSAKFNISFDSDKEITIKVGDINSNDYETSKLQVEKSKEMVTVIFDTAGGDEIKPIEIVKGSKVNKPTNPTNGDRKFEGWFTDDSFHDEFDFNNTINQNITLYAKWSDVVENNSNKTTEYNITDDNKNIITFKEEANHQYKLTMNNYLGLSKEDLKQHNVDEKEYNEVMEQLKDIAKDTGTLLAFYEIEVEDTEDGFRVTEGPLTIKIKITPEMMKYNKFYLIYISDDFKIVEKPIELKKDGDYLVGELPHLSKYILTGDVVNNADVADTPKTDDNIYTWVIALIISMLVGSLSLIYFRKTIKTKTR